MGATQAGFSARAAWTINSASAAAVRRWTDMVNSSVPGVFAARRVFLYSGRIEEQCHGRALHLHHPPADQDLQQKGSPQGHLARLLSRDRKSTRLNSSHV